VLVAGWEPAEVSPSGAAPVELLALVTSFEAPADVGPAEVGPEVSGDLASDLVEAASPEGWAGGVASGVVPVVAPASPLAGCESELVVGDESVGAGPGSGVAVAVEPSAAAASVTSCVPVFAESTGVAAEEGVSVPVAAGVSSVVPTDPRSARAVTAITAAMRIQQTSVATMVSREYSERE
jgi:hypothetical protein